MSVDVILGLQWGDEGKGKVVDFLCPKYDIVARFQGGPNAGHTIEFDGKKFVLHTLPSGILSKNCLNIVGNGVVVDPDDFLKEVDQITKAGFSIKDNLVISKRASLILPTHRLLDAANEAALGNKKIGSTLRGIGPTYSDKTKRTGLRMAHIFYDDFEDRVKQITKDHLRIIKLLKFTDFDIEKELVSFYKSIKKMREFKYEDTEFLINKMLDEGKSVLAEGAQGTLLDIDFGSYPFVTSSNTISGAVCTGLGVSPKRIGKVKGIFKAYCTRVGSGSFPTELFDETGENLRKQGREFGATTGRPRRCGWLDLVALNFSIMVNGVDELIMMKGDVLSGIDEIKMSTEYKLGGKTLTKDFPSDIERHELEPQYESIKGWSEDITGARNPSELPKQFHKMIEFVEEYTGKNISLVSVGPGRKQTIMR